MLGNRARVALTALPLLFLAATLSWPVGVVAQADEVLTPEERRLRLEREIQSAKEKAEAERLATERAAEATRNEAARKKEAERAAAAERRKAADQATAELRAAQQAALEKAEAEAAALAARRDPFSEFRDCDTCPAMIRIPAGQFTMGDLASGADGKALPGRMLQALGGMLNRIDGKNEERPPRTVEVAAFSVGKYEVTFDQWDACVAAGGCSNYRPADHGWGRGQQPVINVSWNQIQQYLLWINAKTGKRYRLPSEAEWEYVTRAGTKSEYSFGDAVNCAQARFGHLDGTCGTEQRPLPVGQFAANPWGLHDLHGNVWEWVQDCHERNYIDAPANASPRIGGDCNRRMYRGGGWSSGPAWLRAAFRGDDATSARYYDLGFRLVRDNDE